MKTAIIILILISICIPVQANADAEAYHIASIYNDYPDYQKILLVHDYLVNTVEYDFNNGCRNSYGALILGKAVCQGYTFAFKDILDHLEIKSDICIGSVNGEMHSWNMVYLNNQGYFVDVTFDDNSNSYDYFMRTDKRCDFMFTY